MSDEISGWLKGLNDDQKEPQPEQLSGTSLPDWLTGLGGESEEPTSELAEVPDWLHAASDAPDWLKGSGNPDAKIQEENIPIWLRSPDDIAEEKILKAIRANSKELDLSRGGITKLSSHIGKLGTVTKLDLSHNQLDHLPFEFSNLINLLSLDLSDNNFDEIPGSVTKLITLKHLTITDSRAKDVPDWLQSSSADGKLLKIEENIANLVNLETLDLSYNQIKALPIGLENLKKLKVLNLVGNPLPIPPEILSKANEPKAILDYFFSRVKKSLNECKVLVVGQGSVGKTSLIRRILKNQYNPAENKTEGISIERFNFRAKGTTFGMNVWDFGGQEIMHATHQFFLTRRSLYLLVLDARMTQEENRVEYWLKIIQSFGGDSPILIVGNKIDQHPLDIDRSGLQKKYPNIVGILQASAATGIGINQIQEAIAEQIGNMRHVRDALPEAWFSVKSKLENLSKEKNFINQTEFESICNTYQIEEENNQRTLIGFLHDLGVILHFQDDPRLEALGILKPQWVTNGVYKILNSHTLFQNKGILSIKMLSDILQSTEYPQDKQLFIVDMMKKFELCYDITTDKLMLVPDLLPKDEPFTGDWDEALSFQYHYSVLPTSVITRFIVRMNELIHKTIWRSGVILKSGSNIALVKSDVEDKKIFIWVSGEENTRRDFLAAIRIQFDTIHKSLSKLDVHEKVPIPGHPTAVVDFEHLLTLEQKGINEFIPEGMNELVSVKHLLNGVANAGDFYRRKIVLNVQGNIENSTVNIGDNNKID